MKFHRLLQKPGLGSLLLVLLAACGNSSHEPGALSDSLTQWRFAVTDADGGTDGGTDTTPPETLILEHPSTLTRETTATFVVSSSEPGGRFECQLLPAPVFTSCPGIALSDTTFSVSYSNLTEGSKTFRVRAVDASNNVDPTAATYPWTVDTTAPVLWVGASTTNGRSASFEIRSSEPANFECRIDGDAFSSCGNPYATSVIKTYQDLSETSHDFYVRATDAVGNSADLPSPPHWVVDTTPDTTITSKPPEKTRDPFFTFYFSSTTPHAQFECKTEGDVDYLPCSPPMSYNRLADGMHVFAVRAVDAEGIKDSSPDYCSWRVDTTAPATQLDGTPPALTNQTPAQFWFSSLERDATFECRCDGSAFKGCSSPSSCTTSTEGLHTFAVRASDKLGNIAPIPATYDWRLDLTPPVATISSVSTSGTSASFSFTANEPGSFQCRLDTGALGSCSSPANYSNLSADTHTFEVFAIDGALNRSPQSASYSWKVDLSAPDTTVVLQLPTLEATGETNSQTAIFSFDSTKPGSGFMCSLNGRPFTACSSPKSYSVPDIVEGKNTFYVYAVDNSVDPIKPDPSPAFLKWTVDTQPPETSLDDHPPALTNADEARFVFSSSEPGATFECSRDNEAYAACSSPKTYAGLTGVTHTFKVRAVDGAKNPDAEGASWKWTVDTTPPLIQIDSRPPPWTHQTRAVFSFSSNAPDVSYFACRLDDGDYVRCLSPFSTDAIVDPLPEGKHTFSVRATDLAGNSSTAAAPSWTVDTSPPKVRITQADTYPLPTLPITQADAGPPSPPPPAAPWATFSFEVTDPSEQVAYFECQLDGNAFEHCDSPISYERLSDTSHLFTVQAVDKAGNTGPTDRYSWTFHSTDLETSIDSMPPLVTSITRATFTFHANKEVSSYQCSLDNGPEEACSSPWTYQNLANSTHTFRVYAVEQGDYRNSPPDFYTWEVDNVAPETAFSLCPAPLTHQTTIQYAFAPSEPGASFQCSLDGAAFISCDSLPGVKEGFYTLEGRAVDRAGNVDTTPARCTFTVDTTPPATPLLSGPSGEIGNTFATFTFSSEPGASFQCSLDNADFTPCTNPLTYSELTDAVPHAFSVRAVDAAGNLSAPASAHFSVAASPQAPVVEHPASGDVLATQTPTFQGAALPGAKVSVFVDDKPLGTAGVDEAGRWSFQSKAPLQEGLHTMSATVTSANGRTGVGSPPRSFTLDTTAPDTSIDSGPASERTEKEEATFTFSSTEPGGSFACSLDDADFTPCASPLTVEGVSVGAHRMRVAARDVAGNVDKSPAEYTWSRRVVLIGHGGGMGCGSTSQGGTTALALLGLLGWALRRHDRIRLPPSARVQHTRFRPRVDGSEGWRSRS